jgi:8-oxo-dGTP pyrophosphatase MutT (NUDIX family)
MEESFGVIPLRKTKEGWEVFLVCLKSGSHWGFPKGHKEKEETAKETALRELKEETSLEVVSFIQDKPLIEEYFYEKEGKKSEKKVTFFLCLVQGRAAVQKKEILEGEWVLLSEAELKITYPSSRKILKLVEKILKKL